MFGQGIEVIQILNSEGGVVKTFAYPFKIQEGANVTFSANGRVLTIEAAGTRWFDGHGMPDAIPGAKEGDYYLDLDTGIVYKLNWS